MLCSLHGERKLLSFPNTGDTQIPRSRALPSSCVGGAMLQWAQSSPGSPSKEPIQHVSNQPCVCNKAWLCSMLHRAGHWGRGCCSIQWCPVPHIYHCTAVPALFPDCSHLCSIPLAPSDPMAAHAPEALAPVLFASHLPTPGRRE